MTFDWNGYLSVATEFKTRTTGKPHNNENEAMRRVAISRAYYFTYNIATNYAIAHLGYKPIKKAGANQFHQDIQTQYSKQMGDWTLQEIQKILARLNKARKDCDYEANISGDLEKLLESVILEAEKVKTRLSA